MDFIRQPDGDVRTGDWLNLNFKNSEWRNFCVAVAFVKASGVRHIVMELRSFIERGGIAKFIIGIDHRGTSSEGLRMLLDCVGDEGEIWVTHNENPSTFHPKLYLFENRDKATVLVGSGNLTEGGLYTNYEGGIVLDLDLRNPQEKKLHVSVCEAIREWSSPENGISKRLDEDFLDELIRRNLAVDEVRTREVDEDVRGATVEAGTEEESSGLFRRVAVKKPPGKPPSSKKVFRHRGKGVLVPGEEQAEENQKFVMTLQRTDVGVGQTTDGTARRSPEIFIPLIARDANPDFWGWRKSFVEDPARPGKFDRPGVKMRLGGNIIEVNMMTWPVKHDFRLRSEALRSAGDIGDILRIEKVKEGSEFSFYVEIVPQHTSQYGHYLALCKNPTRNSQKRWGYF
jgi:hypothetical protein